MELNELYKCDVCGNIVEIVRIGVGKLVCCDKPMVLLVAGTTDASLEKHVPVIEETPEGHLVKIGAVPHPMLPEHHIEFIEIVTEDGKIARKYLKPGDKPQALFRCKSAIVHAREYCNLHSLWANK